MRLWRQFEQLPQLERAPTALNLTWRSDSAGRRAVECHSNGARRYLIELGAGPPDTFLAMTAKVLARLGCPTDDTPPECDRLTVAFHNLIAADSAPTQPGSTAWTFDLNWGADEWAVEVGKPKGPVTAVGYNASLPWALWCSVEFYAHALHDISLRHLNCSITPETSTWLTPPRGR